MHAVLTSASVVCQIKNSDNITFLMEGNKSAEGAESESNQEVTLCPPFAAGHVFLSSVLDRLAAQASGLQLLMHEALSY